jgi:regulator of protease activity HflC (stomatin/prohibitin superfamily)
MILDAEAEKESAILRAEAQKQKMVKEAEGQAEAIRVVQLANAEGLKMIKEAGADEAVLRLKSLEAFEKAADGQATKIIIGSRSDGGNTGEDVIMYSTSTDGLTWSEPDFILDESEQQLEFQYVSMTAMLPVLS